SRRWSCARDLEARAAKRRMEAGMDMVQSAGFVLKPKEESALTQSKEVKQRIVGEYRGHETDNGAHDAQVALLTNRITELTEHFKTHTKDHHSRRGLLKLVGRRRRLLDYLKGQDLERYRNTIERLGIRK